MKPLVVRDQVKLGPDRALSLSISGMYYRITRSAITVLILALAVAFLSYVLFYGIIEQDTKYHAYDELKDSRMLGEWISRLSSPDQQQAIFENAIAGAGSRLDEYATWGRMSKEQVEALRASCLKLKEFYDYFEQIPRSSRAILIADSDPQLLIKQLLDEERRSIFAGLIAELKLQVPLGSREAFEKLVTEDYKEFSNLSTRIQMGQRLAISRISAVIDTMSLQEAFALKTDKFADVLKQSGFKINDEILSRLAVQAQRDIDMQQLARRLEQPNIRTAVAHRLGVKQSEVNLIEVISWITGKGRARDITEIVGEHSGGEALSAERLVALAKQHSRSVSLQNAVGDEVPYERLGLFSLPSRTLWLILVSFIVCVVGISNTMLMSVTDRFTEIATMKCLGAMDGFIMVLFVFEAMIQGLVGSIVGVILGVVLSIIRGSSGFGGLVFEALPLIDILLIGIISFITGILIAAIAATWPSWTAARLAPMEAMRVD